MVYRTFTQTYDLNTEQGAPTLLGIHSPIGGDMWRFLYPFFMAYKKFKYVGCDITIVNAARLPVDPEQLGKIDGENYVDPRDTLNPIMFKGCHGESLGHVLNSMYGGLTSDIFKSTTLDKETLTSTLENFYYTALGDDSWRKSPVQKTLRIRGLHPLVYGLSTNHQLMPTNSIYASQYAENTYAEDGGVSASSPQSGSFGEVGESFPGEYLRIGNTRVFDPVANSFVSKQIGSIFTNKCSRLGWLDTLQLMGSNNSTSQFNYEQITQLPKIFMGLLMLPPAYLTRQYLRVIISHKVRFSGYRTITTGGAHPSWDPGASTGYYWQVTGNVPDPNIKEAEPISRDAESSMVADDTDYDAIEEVDDDGSE